MNFNNENAVRADEALEQLRRLAQWIHPGMTRYQVELILSRSKGGIQGDPITIYHELPGAKIEITYDRQRWPVASQDRVIAPPRVYATENGGSNKWQK